MRRCFSDSLVSSSFGVAEKITLGGCDEVAGVAKHLRSVRVHGGRVVESLDDGAHLEGIIRPAWQSPAARRLVGGALDLSWAYKQLAAHPRDARLAILACHGPSDNSTKLFRSLAPSCKNTRMGFGSYLRMSVAYRSAPRKAT